MPKIGSVVRELRESKKLTREELAIRLYTSVSTIKRVETNSADVSTELLKQLNKFFQIELHDYFSILNSYGNYKTYLDCMKLKQAIADKDFDCVRVLLASLDKTINRKYKEPYFLYTYSKSLYMIYIGKSSYKSIQKIILSCLVIDNPFDVEFMLKDSLHTFSTYTLINLFSIVCERCGNLEYSNKIIESLYNHLSQNIFNDDNLVEKFKAEYQRLYIAVINNYADSLFQRNDYKKSLEICEYGIEIAVKYQTLQSIEHLYILNAEIHYKLDDVEKSLESFRKFILLCELKNNKDLKDRKTIEFKNLKII